MISFLRELCILLPSRVLSGELSSEACTGNVWKSDSNSDQFSSALCSLLSPLEVQSVNSLCKSLISPPVVCSLRQETQNLEFGSLSLSSVTLILAQGRHSSGLQHSPSVQANPTHPPGHPHSFTLCPKQLTNCPLCPLSFFSHSTLALFTKREHSKFLRGASEDPLLT